MGLGLSPYRRHLLFLWLQSLLVYLTESDWDDERDGGLLRIHPHSSLTQPTDVSPAAGSCVLFDSEHVPHEVMATRREWLVIAGWLLEPRFRLFRGLSMERACMSVAASGALSFMVGAGIEQL